MASMISSMPFLTIFVVCSTFFLFAFSYRYTKTLNRFNGPFLASFTSLGTLYDTWRYGNLPPYIHLHKKYGKIVRVGPTKLSFSTPAAVHDIYRTNALNQKSDIFLAHQQVSGGRPVRTLFASMDEVWHRNVRRRVAPCYAMNSMKKYEHYVDDAISIFLDQLSLRFTNGYDFGDVLDLPRWLRFFADDTITAIAYGTSLGHMETGSDVEGILKFGDSDSKWSILLGQAWWLRYFTNLNPIYLWAQRRGWFLNKKEPLSIRLATTQQSKRKEILAAQKGFVEAVTLTDHFLQVSIDHPEIVGDAEVLAMGLSIIAAGSDTTSISLSAFFYYLLRNLSCYHKLVAEVDQLQFKAGESHISFSAAQACPYLSACIKETFRLHPATRYAPERVVPPQGRSIDGHFIPRGTVVFVSAWVLHRDKTIYGDDSDLFRPERWLEGPIDKLKSMENMLSHFGSGGEHTCLGKNVALMEIFKVVPAILRQFTMELINPEQEWSIKLGSFVSVSDFNVRIAKRAGNEISNKHP